MHHQHRLVFFEPGTELRNGSCGSSIVGQDGLVAGIFRYVDKKSPVTGFVLPGATIKKLGLKLVDSHCILRRKKLNQNLPIELEDLT